MSNWSLPAIFAGLHDDVERRLSTVRCTVAHPSAKGDASENVWLDLLQTYLPQRYRALKAHVVDSQGTFSDQIDVVIVDRQYSPFIFCYEGQSIVPAESVYAVFEAKQTLNAAHIAYAKQKAASVRRLHRTSLPIPHAGGVYPPKPPPPILAGLLTLTSDWSPAFGQPFDEAATGSDAERLDLCCIAAHGLFGSDGHGHAAIIARDKPATAFLFELIARLQQTATVPMIDVRAYARWLLQGFPLNASGPESATTDSAPQSD